MRVPWFVLRGLGALYRAAGGLRNRLYDRGRLRVDRAPLPVVSIGNLTFGGAGKTPATIWLAGILTDAGERVAIVSRGYGGVRESEPLLVAREGRALADARQAGDEPALMALEARAHAVVVGRDRLRAALVARDAGATVILLDDGFQHRRLARDLDIVLVDHAWAEAGAPSQPVDLVREPLSGLLRAGVILLTHAPASLRLETGALAPDLWPARLMHVLGSLPAPARPIVAAAAHRPVAVTMPDGSRIEPAALAGRLVLAVSGIARPDTFEDALRAQQAIVTSHLAFPDHHAFTSADAATIARRAKEAGGALVVTTAKDAVRWPDGAPDAAVLHVAFDVPAASRVAERVSAALARHRAAK